MNFASNERYRSVPLSSSTRTWQRVVGTLGTCGLTSPALTDTRSYRAVEAFRTSSRAAPERRLGLPSRVMAVEKASALLIACTNGFRLGPGRCFQHHQGRLFLLRHQ